jgi:hypothetical protein
MYLIIHYCKRCGLHCMRLRNHKTGKRYFRHIADRTNKSCGKKPLPMAWHIPQTTEYPMYPRIMKL